MIKSISMIGLLSLALLSGGCRKNQNIPSDNVAAINVINGIISEDIQLEMNGSINKSGVNSSSSNNSIVSYGSNVIFYANPGVAEIKFQKPIDQTNLLAGNFTFKKGAFYTLLLAGTSENPESVIIDDSSMPIFDLSKQPESSDSVVYVRFINLSPDAQTIDVGIQGFSANEVNHLSFKQASPFKTYPAKIVSYVGSIGYSTITFEFKEGNNLLATYTLFIYSPFTRFKNIALVLNGMKTPGSGQSGLSVSQVSCFQY